MEEPPKKSELQRRLEIKRARNAALEAARKAAEVPLRPDEIEHRAEATPLAQAVEVVKPVVGEETALAGQAALAASLEEVAGVERLVEEAAAPEEEEEEAEEEEEEAEEEEAAAPEEEQQLTIPDIKYPTLYNPITGALLEDPKTAIQQLELIIKQLKQQNNTIPIGLYGLRNDTSNYDFLLNVFCNPEISLDNMVSFILGRGGNMGSDIYEVLCRLFIFFGGVPGVKLTKDGNYKFMLKAEDSALKIFDEPSDALRALKCKATSKTGVSDITLVYSPLSVKGVKANPEVISYCESGCKPKETTIPQTYLVSVKWYKKEKTAENYDLEKLFVLANKKISSPERKPIDIIVFLKSKRDFSIADARAYRQYTASIANTFFGWEEHVKPFLQNKRREIFEAAGQKGKTPQDIVIEQYLKKDALPTLGLYLHQDIIVTGISRAMKENIDNRYVIGVLPRGGKTNIAGGIIRKYLEDNGETHTSLNIFWITAAPTETRDQVSGDLIGKFEDFIDFEFIEARDVSDFSRGTKKHRVWFISNNLLTLHKKGKSKKRDFLSDLMSGSSLSLVFFDEAHAGASGEGTSQAVNEILDNYSGTRLPLIFLTATYYKVVTDYGILHSNTFIWDYTDVLKTRSLMTESERESSIQNLKERFGSELVQEVLDRRLKNHDSYESMAKPYLDYPELFFLTSDFQKETIDRFIAQNKYNEHSGFDLGSIFSLQHRKDHAMKIFNTAGQVREDAWKMFDNVENPKNIISLLTPEIDIDKTFMDPGSGGEPLRQEEAGLKTTILARIEKLSKETGSRFLIDEIPTLLMFMPVGNQGSPIQYTMPAWASLLMRHKWWSEKYEVACVISGVTTPSTDEEGITVSPSIHIIDSNKTKERLIQLERKLHCSEPKKGLIILAGKMLSMGVSLPCVDAVFLLNDTKSPDDIIQKMYRALTPSINKKSAFVVDLNPVRTLAAMYSYTRASHEKAHSKTAILDIIHNVYSWDADVYDFYLKKGSESRPLGFQQTMRQKIDQLLEKAEKDSEYKVGADIGGYEKKLISNIKSRIDPIFIEKVKGKYSDQVERVKTKIGLKEHSTFTLERGTLVVRTKRHVEDSENLFNENNLGEKEESIDLIIENFAESVGDFVKYLAITTTKDSFEEALAEFESNATNAEATNGSPISLQKNILSMIRSRATMKGEIKDDFLAPLLVEAVKEFSYESSMEVFRQMKGKIDEGTSPRNEVLKIIQRHLTPRQKQKKDFGEVFTPLDLIDDMLSHLPKSVWSNPKLKWLDPANGIGNFPVVVFNKLNEGLKKVGKRADLKVDFTNDKQRKKYIIENMLYMMELQGSNNRIAKKIFEKMSPGAKVNIWTVDSLSKSNEKIFEYFNITHSGFDIIIGNPPFQAFQESKGKRGGGDELYMKFVKKSLELLKENGYLVFVHPPSWRKPEFNDGRKKSKNAGMFKLMAHDNQIEYLEIHSSKDGLSKFQAATRYDFYVLKKTRCSEETLIKDMLGKETKIDLLKLEFLPNFNIKSILKILSTKKEEECELNKCILYERSLYGSDKPHVKSSESSEFKYPLIHSTPKGGPRMYYTNDNSKGFFGIKKVIFGDSGINEPIIDLEGKYGMTQHAMAISIKNEKEGIELSKFLKSNYFTNILRACMWSGFQIDWRLFTYLKNNFWDEEYDEEELVGLKEEPTEGGGPSNDNRLRTTRKIKNK